MPWAEKPPTYTWEPGARQRTSCDTPKNKNGDGCTRPHSPCWRESSQTGRSGKKKVTNNRSLRGAALRSCCHARNGPLYRSQRNSVIPIVDERPLGRAFIAQPEVFHLTWLLPRADKRRSRGLARSCKTVRFYQEELTFPQPEKRFVASCIGAMTKHGDNCFLLFEKLAQERSNSHLVARRLPSFDELHLRTFSVPHWRYIGAVA